MAAAFDFIFKTVSSLDAIFLVTAAVITVYRIIDRIIRVPFIKSLNTRYILITGCDSGFGQAAAVRFDSLRCHEYEACFTEHGEKELKKRCSSRLKTLRLDVTNTASVKKSFNTISQLLQPGRGLWGLINNAGIGSSALGAAEWMTLDNYRECLDVNLIGLVDVTRTFLPLVKLERGRIVNTASILGRAAVSLAHAPYTSLKFAVEGFSDVISLCSTIEVISNMVARNMDAIVEAYEHAVLAKYPRARYSIGPMIRLLIFVDMLPEWLSDRLLQRFVKFPIPASACDN